MQNPFDGKEIWFLTGSQDLYGPETLEQVAQQSAEVAALLDGADAIPVKIVHRPTLKDRDAIRTEMLAANAEPACIGVITWMHTFSPAKMWILGLAALDKPMLHLHTQASMGLPWDTIDMDYMNLNQSAHGDREFGFIHTRLRMGRKVVVGHWSQADVQERIGNELRRLGMQMGVFVASGAPRGFGEVTLASDKPAEREAFLKDMRESVEVAKRVGARWCTVVPGRYDVGREWDYQTALVIDNLKRAAEVCEPAGLVMVLEPLNNFRDHPGLFLSKIPQAYLICRAVASPSCKILFDMYHQQITEGNIIPNIDRAFSEVAYFQVGDNPGRKEPGTGEMNYRNIFRHIHGKGFTGIVGMEHGNFSPGKEGERAVINAYRAADNFPA